jgi:hypothetical protein
MPRVTVLVRNNTITVTVAHKATSHPAPPVPRSTNKSPAKP